jgi:hypothetical protein
MPAKAGIQVSFLSTRKNWIPGLRRNDGEEADS